MTPVPVLLFAFANERRSREGYLRNLPREINALRGVLEAAEAAGLCEWDILTNATLDQIVKAFQSKKYRGRIAVFHFSGHADSFELLLEDAKGENQLAHADGFVPWLASQTGLELVFLNGCYSVTQAEELCERGVPAVVGALSAVADTLAADLSEAFYQALTAGLSIDAAWQSATRQLRARHGAEDVDAYYQADEQRAMGRQMKKVERFPWELRYRDPAGEAPHWNLPDAAGNPLLGVPPIPEHYALPNQPYHFLQRYTADEAAVFFGRGRAIRDLYYRLTAAHGSPLVLLYGQSGAGKSSLLHAGLLPRLEAKYEMIYLRREHQRGLLLQLADALGLDADARALSPKEREEALAQLGRNISQLQHSLAALEGDAREQVATMIQGYEQKRQALQHASTITGAELAEAWRAREAEGEGRPLLVFLDQVEEIITQPHTDRPDELTGLLAELNAIFSQPEQAPKGRVLLSYRKEYHPELTKALAQHNLPREEVFLERLDRQGVIEIVTGLQSTERLRNKYNLTVEPALAEEIAANLLSDPDSPVAPILQIILAKLWETQAKNNPKAFRLEDYYRLREEGILLSDFFRQQLGRIREQETQLGAPVERSGLALDLLHYHTTRLGAARGRDLRQTRLLYSHHPDQLFDRLIAAFKAEYLLTDAGEDTTALAHDTLAPLVQREMRDSDRPGQRALRILENKVVDYLKDPETIIEEEDLSLVEEGRAGMRVWLPMEQEIVEKSREHREQLRAERRRNRQFRYAAVGLLTVAALVVFFLWRQSEQRRRQLLADDVFKSGQLLVADDPTAGLARIWQAYLADPRDTHKLTTAYQVYSQEIFYDLIGRETHGYLNAAAFSPDGRFYAAATDQSNTVYYYAVADGRPVDSFTQAHSRIYDLAFGPDGDLYIASADRRAYRWRPTSDAITVFPSPGPDTSAVRQLVLSPDGSRLLTLHQDDLVRLWSTIDGRLLQADRPEQPAVAAALDTANRIWLALRDGRMLGPEGELAATLVGTPTALAISRDNQLLALGDDEGVVQVFRRGSNSWQAAFRLDHQGEAIAGLCFDSLGQLLLVGTDNGHLHLWDLARERRVFQLRGHRAAPRSLAFAPDLQAVFSAAADSTIRRWALPYPLPVQTYQPSPYGLEALAFVGDDQVLLGHATQGIVSLFLPKGSSRLLFDQLSAAPTALAVSDDGQLIAGGDAEGNMQVWNRTDGNSRASKRAHQDRVNALLVTPDVVISAGEDQQLFYWSYKQGAAPRPLAGHRYEIEALALAGDRFYSAGLDSTVIAWSLADGQLLERYSLPEGIVGLARHPTDGKLLALGASGQAYFPLGDQTDLTTLPAGRFLAWLSGGDRYVAVADDRCALDLRSADGYLLQRLYGPPACRLSSLAVAPDGSLVVAGDEEGRLYAWRPGRVDLRGYIGQE